MKCKYTCAYHLHGVESIGREADTKMFKFPENETHAVLTSNPDEHCFNADRGTALNNVILNWVTGQSQETDIKLALENELLSIRKARKDRYEAGVFLVFHGEKDIDVPHEDAEGTGVLGDFGIRFCKIDKASIRDHFKSSVNGILCALCLVLPASNTFNIANISDSIYLINANGKIIYCPQSSLSALLSLGSILTIEVEQFIDQYVQKLGEDKDIARVSKLLVQSLQITSDNLHSFISAWTALEIFVNKVFMVYKDEAENTIAYKKEFCLRKNKDADKSKWILFIGISSLLSESTADKDQDEYEDLKKTRNRFIHPLKQCYEVADADLPTLRVQTLLRKYLRLYIEKSAASQK